MTPVSRRRFLQRTAVAAGAAVVHCGRGAQADEQPMKARIASVETFAVSYPVVGKFKFLKGRDGRPPGRDCVVISIRDDEGRVGWGESIPSHTWSYETLESTQTTIDRYLGPALIGQDAFDREAIRTILDRTIAASFSTGQPLCKAGIDLALFDLTGRILNRSAEQRWGRKSRDKITISWTLNPQSLDEVAESIAEAHERGFRNFNLKVGRGADFDVAVCREIRRMAHDAFLWVDANGGYDLETALAIAPKFADLGIDGFEQPLPSNRLTWYRRLKRQGALPILMDEPILTAVDLEEFHRMGLLDGVTMKMSRCGGLEESCRVLDYVQQNGLLFFASGLTDPDLSFAGSLLLFAAYHLEHPAALNAPQFLDGSLLVHPIEVVGDQATVPQGPGLGVEVDEAKLKELRIRT